VAPKEDEDEDGRERRGVVLTALGLPAAEGLGREGAVLGFSFLSVGQTHNRLSLRVGGGCLWMGGGGEGGGERGG
jgi:hypothetical protein